MGASSLFNELSVPLLFIIITEFGTEQRPWQCMLIWAYAMHCFMLLLNSKKEK